MISQLGESDNWSEEFAAEIYDIDPAANRHGAHDGYLLSWRKTRSQSMLAHG